MIRIGILNDTHLGITKIGALTRCFERLAEQKPDIIIHAGDYCGATEGHRTLRVTCELLRKTFPDTPILSVIGNHDYWAGPSPSLAEFLENYRLILQAFKDSNIHFLDTDGIWRQDDITILGESGWYHTYPTSNDWNFIPKGIDGDTHLWLQRKSYDRLDEKLSQLTNSDTTRIFVSHFPILDCNPWDGNPNVGKLLKDEYGVKYFISGHSHGAKNGPLHYRSDSDYYVPTYTTLEVADDRSREESTTEQNRLLATDG